MVVAPKDKTGLMGWCMTGHHAGTGFGKAMPCPGQPPSNPKALQCSCWCHHDPVAQAEWVAKAEAAFTAHLKTQGRLGLLMNGKVPGGGFSVSESPAEPPASADKPRLKLVKRKKKPNA